MKYYVCSVNNYSADTVRVNNILTKSHLTPTLSVVNRVCQLVIRERQAA